LTPRVIKTAKEADAVYKDKRDDFEELKKGSFKLYQKYSPSDKKTDSDQHTKKSSEPLEPEEKPEAETDEMSEVAVELQD